MSKNGDDSGYGSSSDEELPLSSQVMGAIQKSVDNYQTPDQKLQESPKNQKSVQVNFLSPVKPTPKRVTTSDQKGKWEDLLKCNLCIGENHHGIAAKKFLIQNFKMLKTEGYESIIIEHLPADELQSDMDNFVAGDNKTAQMSARLENKINELSNNFLEGIFEKDLNFIEESKKYNFATLVKAAKYEGLKIICAEKSVADYEAKDRFIGRERVKNLNNLIKAKVTETKLGKWIAFVGIGHIYERKGVPGIVEIIENTESLICLDTSKGTSSLNIYDEPTIHSIEADSFLASKVLTLKFGDDASYKSITSLIDKGAKRTLGNEFDVLSSPPPKKIKPIISSSSPGEKGGGDRSP